MALKSCELFTKKTMGAPVARVDEAYLYKEDIEALITPEMSAEDSVIVVNRFVNRWATQQLLMEGARRNISLSEQERLDGLVDQYKLDLYSQAYKDGLVAKTLDTAISNTEAEKFYEQNPANFKLNEELFKLRYIHMGEGDYDQREIKRRFVRFDSIDKKYLDSISVQFKAHALNDSIWIDKTMIIAKIDPITAENEAKYLKKTDFLELRDSLGLYLISIREHLKRNEEAPLEYVMPTVKQIILNRRKLELLKELEKDITKDAIKNKQFEIYN
ncbi:peptidyl-prolyl cis-trans isomerase [Flavimarina sp. Hel_I_48]|uniref:peptidyl-prolyl cis-trans isomerase n=1 Tax=Flavimarina sp. Hel_I_48 TaxID=1392488 RepID=UPI001F128FB5|nr:peptidyl-prolyl cis-trans isomerase [Flavimarina sp. Hel_I_48]